jgi:hypothetical protein
MLLNQKANKALHLPAFPLHSKASGELDRSLRNDNMKTRAFLIFCAVGFVDSHIKCTAFV